MSVQSQAQLQKEVPTQAIAQVDSVPVSANLAFVRDPIFWTILALAVLVRVILDRPSSDKK
ncbi:hypothetical protein [Pseudanabaena mucicola]|uniref:Uncharacterized protein n=1 Tax=Pseudanabaena mucicola FACHB-723 TaxID=2692860 RepID=A0ABR7ZUU7_9CYAN|nr:hypothetical protein [Pseudanabaena mucicola]MBD2187746.1 hypothetical protein [Pseudanabaena mucicola FACHB-723]